MNDYSDVQPSDLAKAVYWLQREIVADARGDAQIEVSAQPSALFWLGRLSPEVDVANADDDRLERLAPCAIGLRIRPATPGPWYFKAKVTFTVWTKVDRQRWRKNEPVIVEVPVEAAPGQPAERHGREAIGRAIQEQTGRRDVGAAIDVTGDVRFGQNELVVQLVNTSDTNDKSPDERNLYEAVLEVGELDYASFQLEGLEDAFRYDREMASIGLNCAVEARDGWLKTQDVPEAPRRRPRFNPPGVEATLLEFATLASDCRPSAQQLQAAHAVWGEANWAPSTLAERAKREQWTAEMVAAAEEGRQAFWEENQRIAYGARLLEENDVLRRAFELMNDALALSAKGRYTGWRAFQLGFLLANLNSLVDPAETDVADIVWFATGGGKTETYLGLLVTAMLLDRMQGKHSGITAWSRFPLRMLSLQQTQRFADAIAAAELIRRKNHIDGDTLSLGFFVGQGATPNAFKVDPKDNEPSPYDEDALKQFLVLDRCPFCRDKGVAIRFDLPSWTLQHRCTNASCMWGDQPLPFYVVDQEIFRFLPTVVVGTLDKAASIGMQAAMRGFVGSPLGKCTGKDHGFTYAPRSDKPQGCLVPGCKRPVTPISAPELFAPSMRLQDELHLLRDSLGAVDSHYEALYDHLSLRLAGRKPKILGSSATLAGYQHQVDTLYRRKARVFPQPGPAPGVGFWTSDSDELMRHYIALAPRGVTVEHAVDRILTVLQRSVRALIARPDEVCAEIGVNASLAPTIVNLYGTNVVYGNTLRDLDAMSRSAETQVLVEGRVTSASLTGRSGFEEVRKTLADLEAPAEKFEDRIHVIMASSMMSHGVDIDRLNVMTMVGFPLGTAEFIQATARVGRRYPGLVILVPKMGRERDAGIYRTFPKFVEHADRLVDSIPITRRSRRVLARTLPGMELARILMLDEPEAGKALTMAKALRQYRQDTSFDPDTEVAALVDALGLIGDLDASMRKDIATWIDQFMRNVNDPPSDVRFTSEAAPGQGAMRSLRDVEETVPIYGKEDFQ